jgi:hypothetical protein
MERMGRLGRPIRLVLTSLRVPYALPAASASTRPLP